jgi:hypothetical protein
VDGEGRGPAQVRFTRSLKLKEPDGNHFRACRQLDFVRDRRAQYPHRGADSGRNYDSTIALKGANTLRVQGSAFGGMFCGGQLWNRVS